jgi:hypothetical protein
LQKTEPVYTLGTAWHILQGVIKRCGICGHIQDEATCVKDPRCHFDIACVEKETCLSDDCRINRPDMSGKAPEETALGWKKAAAPAAAAAPAKQ